MRARHQLAVIIAGLCACAAKAADAPTTSPAATTAPAAASQPSIDWTAWRERQQRELAVTTRPADPPADTSAHPVDAFLSAWWLREKTAPPPTCDDATFARRAYLDAIGLPPTEQQLKNFSADTRADKRARLVDTLLGDNPAYAEGWMAYWCDLLRNDEQTSIDGLRKPITQWLFDALRTNKPYDRMVAELLYPLNGGPEGYLKGINWRGAVNASQQPAMQAAQNVGQVFMATNIKCASCHDHFTKPYMLEDSYSLASFFSETNLEVYRCDKPTGVIAPPAFPLKGMAAIPPTADRVTRLRSVAEMVTTPRNPRFARTMVNRLWKKLMGRGLFEPVDDFTAKCANPELLDWLSYDFMKHDYDLKHTIRLLMTSRAYELRPVLTTAESGKRASKDDKALPVYTGPPLRHLSSEQILDGISQMTGYWPKVNAMGVSVSDTNLRAWRHRVPDALARALGRPAREQVTTVRVEDPSLLQMLEMLNGKVLAERMAKGAEALLASPLGSERDIAAVVDTLHLRAFGRPATAAERDVLVPLLGTPEQPGETRRPGWEDVCWMLVASPDFQYIQ